MAMGAAVLERHRRAVLLAEKHDRLAENHPPHRLAPDLMVIGGDVPEVSQEHGAAHSLSPRRLDQPYHVTGRET